jgi:hypothetical protein
MAGEPFRSSYRPVCARRPIFCATRQRAFNAEINVSRAAPPRGTRTQSDPNATRPYAARLFLSSLDSAAYISFNRLSNSSNVMMATSDREFRK